jgi:hypothetical protein
VRDAGRHLTDRLVDEVRRVVEGGRVVGSRRVVFNRFGDGFLFPGSPVNLFRNRCIFTLLL